MFGTLYQCCRKRHSIVFFACLMSLAIVETRTPAQDFAVAQAVVAAESQPPAFASNDRFDNLTRKSGISDRFRSLACDAEELDNRDSPLNLISGPPCSSL